MQNYRGKKSSVKLTLSLSGCVGLGWDLKDSVSKNEAGVSLHLFVGVH